MAGLSKQLQKGLGRFTKQWYRVANRFKVDYTVVTDLTDVANNKTLFSGIFLKKTPAVKSQEFDIGRTVTIKPGGGTLSQEALPIFLVSRESLKTGTTYHEPTKFDTFVETGTTEPKFYIKDIETVGEDAAAYRLTVTTIFNEHAGGHHGG